jgi:hypothetical protein
MITDPKQKLKNPGKAATSIQYYCGSKGSTNSLTILLKLK